MDYIIKETLKKEKKSVVLVIASGFGAIIILNLLITLTNNLGKIQNIVCVMLLFIFSIIILIIIEKIFGIYTYLLGNNFITFERHFGKKKHVDLTVEFKQIKKISRLKDMEVNPDVQATYYFVYRYMERDCYYCEYEQNSRLYRFIFKPSERLIRILERKIKG